MTCPTADELVDYFAKQIGVERSTELDHHVPYCAQCRVVVQQLEDIKNAVGQRSADWDDTNFAKEVANRIAQQHSPRYLTRRFSGLTLALAVAATLVGIVVIRGPAVDDEFRARSSALSADAWVSIHVYQKSSGGVYRPATSRLEADETLAFAYTNRAPSNFRYLMIFGVDGVGKLYWFYPDADATVESVTISAADQPIELREDIPISLPKGRLRVAGLFSTEPMRVQQIAELVHRENISGENNNRFTGDAFGQHWLDFVVD